MTKTAINNAIVAGFPHARIKWSGAALKKSTPETLANIHKSFDTFAKRQGKPRERLYVRMVHLTNGDCYPSARTRNWIAWMGMYNAIAYYIGVNVSKFTDDMIRNLYEPHESVPWHLVDSPDEWILHELGHIRARCRELQPAVSKNLLHHASAALSGQASLSEHELYAELFAARVAGTSIPDTFSRYMESIQ